MKLLEHPNIIKLYEVGHICLPCRRLSSLKRHDSPTLHPSFECVCCSFRGGGSEDKALNGIFVLFAGD
jgi:hypothetical protein